MRDFLEFTARQTLQFPPASLPAAHREELKRGLRQLMASFDMVLSFDDAALLESLKELMQGAFLIGALATISNAAKIEAAEQVLVNKAADARQKNVANAAARKKKLRPAIIEAAGKIGVEIVGTVKFAESIFDDVRAIVGADSAARGFSDRSIQREIRAILKECGSGPDHS